MLGLGLLNLTKNNTLDKVLMNFGLEQSPDNASTLITYTLLAAAIANEDSAPAGVRHTMMTSS